MTRRPEQIIGKDALTQLIFEGYVVLPAEPTPRMIEAAWQTVVKVDPDNRMAVLLMDAKSAHSVKMLNRYKAMVQAELDTQRMTIGINEGHSPSPR